MIMNAELQVRGPESDGYMDLLDTIRQFEVTPKSVELSTMTAYLREFGARRAETDQDSDGYTARARFYEMLQREFGATTYSEALEIVASGRIAESTLAVFNPALQEILETEALRSGASAMLDPAPGVELEHANFSGARVEYLRGRSNVVEGLQVDAGMRLRGLPDGRRALLIGEFGSNQIAVVHSDFSGSPSSIGVSIGDKGRPLSGCFIEEAEVLRDGGTLRVTAPGGLTIEIPHSRSASPATIDGKSFTSSILG